MHEQAERTCSMTVLLAGQIRKADRLDVCSEFLYCVLSLSTLAGCVHDDILLFPKKAIAMHLFLQARTLMHAVMATVVGTHDRYPFVSQKGNSYACVSTSKNPNACCYGNRCGYS